MNNFILIGMSSVGKSKSGLILSKLLNIDFYDEDEEVEKKFGLIHINRDVLSKEQCVKNRNNIYEDMSCLNNTVISAGGQTGMVYDLSLFNGLIILLKPSLEFIQYKYKLKKLDTSSDNLRRKLVFDTEENIEKEYYKRYEIMIDKADIVVDTSFLNKNEIAKLIKSKIELFK